MDAALVIKIIMLHQPKSMMQMKKWVQFNVAIQMLNFVIGVSVSSVRRVTSAGLEKTMLEKLHGLRLMRRAVLKGTGFAKVRRN